MAEKFSWVPYPAALCPPKSLTLSVGVSLDSAFLSVRQEPNVRPWNRSALPATNPPVVLAAIKVIFHFSFFFRMTWETLRLQQLLCSVFLNFLKFYFFLQLHIPESHFPMLPNPLNTQLHTQPPSPRSCSCYICVIFILFHEEPRMNTKALCKRAWDLVKSEMMKFKKSDGTDLTKDIFSTPVGLLPFCITLSVEQIIFGGICKLPSLPPLLPYSHTHFPVLQAVNYKLDSLALGGGWTQLREASQLNSSGDFPSDWTH